FGYRSPDGKALRDAADLKRIRALAIPPAWTDVWICPSPLGHIQAFGRDARGRKQYRYHPRWRDVRDETKYGQLVEFGALLPAIRKRVQADLARTGMPREKVLAAVVDLLDKTMIRVGNEEYARTNQSFGLTTLRGRHVKVAAGTLEFRFRGKSGKEHRVRIVDRRLARIVKACQDLPGHELFQYVDGEGAAQSIGSADVNAYLREIAGADVSAKVFRTWAGTVRALAALRALQPEAADEEGGAATKTATTRTLVGIVKEVAATLGNTPAVCRKCYIHPAVMETFQRGALQDALARIARRSTRGSRGLDADERLTLAFLADWQRKQARAPSLVTALRRSVKARARESAARANDRSTERGTYR
ncbi:MAG: DNA topoisomerase IB, partial [Candidatus Eisenbacteria bacterium]